MKNLKKTLSVFLSLLLFAAVMFTGYKPVQAAEVAAKGIDYAAYEHSPLLAGEKQGFFLSAKGYAGQKVQYSVWLNDKEKGTWENILAYGTAQNPEEIVKVVPEKVYQPGKYQVSIWVKADGKDGIKSNANGSYDNYFVLPFACAAQDASKWVTSSGDLKVSVAGNKVTLNSIDGIKGMSGSYLYKIHLRDMAGNWIIDNGAYRANASIDAPKAGKYLVDVWAADSKNPTVREVIKLGLVDVGTTTADADILQTTVAKGSFGSVITASIKVNGTADYATAAKFQVFVNGEAKTSMQTLGKGTTVYPEIAAGTKVTIKLFDAAGKEVVAQDVTLGTDAELPVTTTNPTDVTINATSVKGSFGSVITVTATGDANAAKFQVFVKGEAKSSMQTLGKGTTVYPDILAGETVTVKLFDAAGKELASKDVVLK